MIKRILPDIYAKSIFDINYDLLKMKKIKYIFIDVDNTISPAKQIMLSTKVKKLFNKLNKDFKIVLFSNNFKSKVSKIAEFYNTDYAYLSLKPLIFKYIYLLKKYKIKKNEVIAVGDQIVTDVIGAKKVGIKVALVDPLTEIDSKSTYLNRKLENIILKSFKKHKLFEKGKYYE